MRIARLAVHKRGMRQTSDCVKIEGSQRGRTKQPAVYRLASRIRQRWLQKDWKRLAVGKMPEIHSFTKCLILFVNCSQLHVKKIIQQVDYDVHLD